MQTIIIKRNDAGGRLDKFLIKYLKSMPQSLIYKSLRKKRIKANGKAVTEKYILQEGDRLDLYINDEFFEKPAMEKGFMAIKKPLLSIIYEDENILLINKPPGMVVHTDNKKTDHTLIDHVQSYLYQKGEYQPEKEYSFAPALCNRIDRNTRGIVIAAKNVESLRILNEKIRWGEIDKFYLCIVRGIPKQKSATLISYFVKDEKQNKIHLYNEQIKGSKSMITKYRVVEQYHSHALLEIKLVTGRSHQIRAHMAHIGHPLLGDGKYGGLEENSSLKHQLLCSYKVVFDFHTPSGILEYLKGKSFVLKDADYLLKNQLDSSYIK